MSKNEKNTAIESMTMPEAMAALNDLVEKYNNSMDAAERVKMELEAGLLTKQHNTLSLLTAYATVIADNNPIVALAKAYNYPVVSFKTKLADAIVDGKVKKVKVASIENGVKTHDLYAFMEWTASHNRKVAHAIDWKPKAEAARAAINDEWKKFMESDDGYKMSKTAIKNAVQSMFDALVFIPCENNPEKNAVIAKGDIANYLIALAARLKVEVDDGKINFKVDFMSGSNWKSKAFDVLHMAIEGKTFDVVYGDPEESANSATVETTPAEGEVAAK